ncbi:MAG: EAL domain-containing protein [Methylobacter sp.]
MKFTLNKRNGFIALAIATYSILALAWIFLTDELLKTFVDIEPLLWLSTAKGVFFVIASAAMFFLALRAVPPVQKNGSSACWDTVTHALAPDSRTHWSMYLFAIVITVAMVAVRESIAVEFVNRPMLILFMFPIALCALLGGFGPGLVSTLIAALAVDYLAIPPLRDFAIAAKHDLIQWLFLIINGIAVSLLSEILRRALAKAELNQHLLNVVVSGTSDPVFIKDAQGRYQLINAAAATIVGKTPEAILGRDDYFLFPENTARELMAKDLGIMSGSADQFYEEHITTFDGKEIDFSVNKGPVFNHAGQVIGLFGISRDITERKRAEATYRSLYDNMMNSVVHCRVIFEQNVPIDLEYISVNPAFAEVTGIRENPVGRRISELIPGYCENNRESLEIFGGVALSGEPRRWEHYLAELDRWFSFYIFATATDEITVIAENISERKRAEKKLQLVANVFSHAREGIMITDVEGTIIDVNDAFSSITGFSRDEVLGENPRILSSGRHGKDFYAAFWRALREKGFWCGEIWNRCKNGEIFAEMLTVSSIKDDQGETQQFVALFSDITAFKEHEKQLEYIAHYDTLTQLPNRVLLADRICQSMHHALRHEQSLAVIYLDLDGFKLVNDRHGHDVGDQLLVSVAAKMKETLRDGDTLARLGGDEFVAVLLDLDSIEVCLPIINRMLAAAAHPVMINNLRLQVSGSLGVTFYPQTREVDADLLLRQADQAMYQAKLKGKNRYHVFDAEQDNDIRGYHERIERLRLALINREFVLYYQPKVNMRTGKVVGAEALIRWQHPELGLVPPADFLPLIEDHPLAVEIGEWVLDAALAQIELWRLDGLDIPVSVNVGAYQLQNSNFVERLSGILEQHPQVRPSRLELEVLETSALEDIAEITQIIESCRELGVAFALDDFGTGYSSLTYLKNLPVTLLKIDQSFVRDMLDDPDDLAILEGVLGMSSAFRRLVIAEGVETAKHGQMLLELGCELGQGYGIARPMPADAMPSWTASWRIDPSWVNVLPVSREDLPLIFARVEHRAWLVGMENYINGLSEVLPVLDEDECRLGNWLKNAGLAQYGDDPDFQRIMRHHHELHELAKDLFASYSNRSKDLDMKLADLHSQRDTLIESLCALQKSKKPSLNNVTP